MKNISFDNPYILLLAIPLIALLLVSYFVTIKKDNKSRGVVTSLVLHVFIVLLVVLAASGIKKTVTVTKTQVYVVADVSHSSSNNLDLIDEYIQNVNAALPDNSEMGVVCFGKNYVINTPMGDSIKSVSAARVDTSATNVAKALKYTAALFDTNVNKRIVLITDGKDSNVNARGELVLAINNLKSQDIKIDAIYVDNNIKDGDKEIQITDVGVNESTYVGKENKAEILIESSYDGAVSLSVGVKGPSDDDFQTKTTNTVSVYRGFNTYEIPLDSSAVGAYDYRVSISVFESGDDLTEQNNSFIFSQNVTSGIKALLIAPSDANADAVKNVLGDNAEVETYIVKKENSKVPYTVEELCGYDEIIISDIDIRNIANVTAFVESLDIAVSKFGKTLLTLGDLSIQNKVDSDLESLQDMLAVNYGNPNQRGKLFTIVLDASYSMDQAMKFKAEKTAAKHLLTLLDKDDEVMIVSFAGGFKIELAPTKASQKAILETTIDNITPKQGTMIGAGLDAAYEIMANMTGYEEMQIMLISDGVTFAHEPESAEKVAEDLAKKNIAVSAINVLGKENASKKLLSSVAEKGNGNYYYLENVGGVDELIFSSVANDVTKTIIEEKTQIEINLIKDPTISGIMLFPDIYGYVQSSAKSDAKIVLKVKSGEEGDVTVPIYSYRDYGNGRVANFASSLSRGWLDGWSDSLKEKLFVNMLFENLPDEKVDYPFTFEASYDGENITVKMNPAELKADASAVLNVVTPSGEILDIPMDFNARDYTADFVAADNGKYSFAITYTYLGSTYVGNGAYNVAYAPEYNSFAVFTASDIYDFMGGAGEISESGSVSLENSSEDVAFYRYNFAAPLFAAAVALFVLDIIIRKLKWSDVKSLFGRKSKGGIK